MSKLNLVSAIFQFVAALALVGVSVYYYVVGNTFNFVMFLVIGIVFAAMAGYAVYKFVKKRKRDRDDGEEQ